MPSVVFNAVGTTHSTAGSVAAQWAIDHDLCIENAKAAGVKTHVYCSSAGTSGSLSPFVLTPHAKMKRGVEQQIEESGFDNAIILRPGMILGRETPKNKWLEDIFDRLKIFGQGFQDKWGERLYFVLLDFTFYIRMCDTDESTQGKVRQLLGGRQWQL